jgi:hypothetical protein
MYNGIRMPAITKINNLDVIHNVLQSTLDSVVASLTECGLPVPARRYVAFCDPPQDCCPDLVVWADNITPDDMGLGQGLTRGYFTCTNTWSMIIHVRIGLCYVDFSAEGDPLSADVLSGMSREMNRYWQCFYMRFGCAALNGGISELDDCSKFGISPSTCYATGGCAGFEFTLNVPMEN